KKSKIFPIMLSYTCNDKYRTHITSNDNNINIYNKDKFINFNCNIIWCIIHLMLNFFVLDESIYKSFLESIVNKYENKFDINVQMLLQYLILIVINIQYLYV